MERQSPGIIYIHEAGGIQGYNFYSSLILPIGRLRRVPFLAITGRTHRPSRYLGPKARLISLYSVTSTTRCLRFCNSRTSGVNLARSGLDSDLVSVIAVCLRGNRQISLQATH